MAEAFNPLDTLRQAFNPRDDVKFELKVNEHPKGHTNKSIVNAINMKLSDDGVVLENDNKIEEVDAITTALNNRYGNNRKIVHVLPCNRELVLFVARDMNVIYTSGTIDIWRYSEESNTVDIFYSKGIPWYGGTFSSTFTYTSNNSLIIAFCEHDSIGFNKTYDCPLRTINLGDFNKSNNVFNDRDIEPYKTPLCPEVCLPQIQTNNIINGASYVGTYYFYIRYKINQYDYTQWYNFGYPIYHEHIDDKLVHKKIITNSENKDVAGNDAIGAHRTTITNDLYIAINNNNDNINYSIIIDILHSSVLYEYCQIGYICVSNTYTKYYISSDIKLQNFMQFDTNVYNLKEEQFNISSYENYFNVKNIININNKLYISNYITFNQNKNVNIDDIYLSLRLDKYIDIDNLYDNSNIIKFNNLDFDKDTITTTMIFKKLDTYKSHSYPSDNWRTNKGLPEKYVNMVYFLYMIGKSSYITKNKYQLWRRYSYYDSDGVLQHGSKVVTDESCYLYELYVAVDMKHIITYTDYNQTSVDIEYDTPVMSIAILPTMKTYNLTGNNDKYIKDYISYGTINDFSNKSIIDADFTVKNVKDIIHDVDILTIDSMHETIQRYEFTLIDSTNSKNRIAINDNSIISTNICFTYQMNPLLLTNNIYKINTIKDLVNNNNVTGLVQGEIYDFYIHFINKYGNTTNGYRIPNRNTQYTYTDESGNKYYTSFYRFYSTTNGKDCIAMIPDLGNIYVTNDDGSQSLRIYNQTTWIDVSSSGYVNNYRQATTAEFNEIKNSLSHLLDIPDSIKCNLKFSDIFDEVYATWYINFLPFINNNGDKLYKVPKITMPNNKSNIIPVLGIDVNYGIDNKISKFLENNGFVSYFISYKQLEHTYTIDGIGNENQLSNILLNTKCNVGYLVHKYPISKINTSITNVFYKENIYLHSHNTIYANFNNTIGYADNNENNRNGRHTALYLSNDKTELNHKDFNYVEILNVNKNIYTTNKFNLFRLGNILGKQDTIINVGLNGRYKNHIVLWYGNESTGVSAITSDIGRTSYGNVFCIQIYGFYDDNNNGIYTDEIINSITIYKSYKTDSTDYKEILGTESFYDVINTLTLFKYKIGNIYDSSPEIYTHVISNYYLNEFNNTIYRSNVISDEGRVNNWRYFESNAYRNINENKGFITNLVHIGKYLYVHTQHSLFAFNNDAALEMNNKNLQVATPDLFDTEYSEAYLTNLGYGGLQDKESSIVGTFGYMYYNRDNNEIIRIYSTDKKIITDDIKTLFNNLNIQRVIFMNDSVNNRVFIQITHQYTTSFPIGQNKTNTQYIVLSYNYKINKFISLHSTLMEPITQQYATNGNVRELNVDSFRYAVNTKDTLYMFNKDDFKYSLYKFGKGYNNLNKVSIIFNSYYDTIKYVEYLVYKLRKTNNVVNDAFNFNRLPVEKEDIPYSGVGIRIYNDLVDTGWIDVRQANTSYKDVDNTVDNYSKPYYQLGNWIFNFIRTKSITDSSGNIIPTRLFGNYFVVEFNFGINTEKIEFEFTDLITSKDKRI